MRLITMIVVAALTLLLVNVPLSQSCDGEGQVLICQNTPFDFSPGFLTLVILLKDIGEINATEFRSSNLASVTRLRIDSAGVTGIAEGAFSSLQNLTSVSLRHNALTQVNSNWFGRPTLLREISLEENQIEVLNESTLAELTGLAKLSLRTNRIRTIEPNSFLSQTNLSELDLSGNRMTRVSPQVFRTLRSTRIRLDGNPWDCSCAAEEFVLFLKDLQSRSLLVRPMEVTCETPPPLRGRPVWNASVCLTSPSPGPPSASQTADLGPTDAPPTVPASSVKVVTASPQTTSVQNRSTDAPTTVSSHTPATDPTQPTTETSARTLSTRQLTTQTVTHVTAPPSETEGLSPPPTGATDTHTVCALIIVIVVLCVLLFVVCFLVLQLRRRRNNKTVMPGRPEEEEEEEEEKEVENSSRSNPDPSPEESRDPEGTGRRPFTGLRAKSAGAILFMSPSCVSLKDQVVLQQETEAPSTDREAAGREQKVGNEAGGIQTENLTNTPDMTQRRTDAGGSPHDSSHCVSVSTDTVAYLSIGTTSLNKPSPYNLSKQPTDSSGQRSQMGKVMGRISTWPPTAVQWQARCKMMQEMEEGKKTEERSINKQERPCFCEQDEKEETQIEDVTTPDKDPLKRNTPGMKLKLCEVQTQSDTKQEDPATVAPTGSVNQKKHNHSQQDNMSVEKPAHNSRSTKSDEARRAVTSRRRPPDNPGTGSRARSSGASPDDETLLRGNEYAFMDLLHEVAQNNGRWTRERWRQVHVNKQRR